MAALQVVVIEDDADLREDIVTYLSLAARAPMPIWSSRPAGTACR